MGSEGVGKVDDVCDERREGGERCRFDRVDDRGQYAYNVAGKA